MNDQFQDELAEDDERPAEQIRPRRQRKSIWIKLFSFITTLALAIFLGVGALIYNLDKKFNAPGINSVEITTSIKSGTSTRQIAEQLERDQLISSSSMFLWGLRILRPKETLKAGEFRFSAQASMADVADEIIAGRSIQYSVTVPEGWSSYQIVERLKASDQLNGEIKEIPLEGSLLPQTYLFERGASAPLILQEMKTQFNKTVDDIWKTRAKDLPLKNKQELVILASIVEKETGQKGERARVASVFLNRLRRGMRLETDPTILYGIYGGKAWLKPRIIRRSELKKKTPYNTYQINGLPPGPIANPGRAALEAVANPAATKDIFFVADGTGGHAFAKTLKEHNANVAKWRKVERQRRAQKKKKAKAQ